MLLELWWLICYIHTQIFFSSCSHLVLDFLWLSSITNCRVVKKLSVYQNNKISSHQKRLLHWWFLFILNYLFQDDIYNCHQLRIPIRKTFQNKYVSSLHRMCSFVYLLNCLHQLHILLHSLPSPLNHRRIPFWDGPRSKSDNGRLSVEICKGKR